MILEKTDRRRDFICYNESNHETGITQVLLFWSLCTRNQWIVPEVLDLCCYRQKVLLKLQHGLFKATKNLLEIQARFS